MAETPVFYQETYRNPHASQDLVFSVAVMCNTPMEDRENNVRVNSRRDLKWINMLPAHDRRAVLCGGGPSLADHIEDIKRLQQEGADVFTMNGSSKFLRERGIIADAQIIADAKPETVELYDHEAKLHYIASQCDPAMFEQGGKDELWHLILGDDVEQFFPEEKRKRGGYALIGGVASVGHSAQCLTWALGYRKFDLYGYDSSNRGINTHAYNQMMNRFIPNMKVDWGGKTYETTVAMRAQAERMTMTIRQLREQGCEINVHGEGLLPAMVNFDGSDLTEQDKYRLLWGTDIYREHSPGEMWAHDILNFLKPDSMVLDFGCGSGRASRVLADNGIPVFLMDFAENCRDECAMDLPFLQWDLTKPIPPKADYGICCDVMEHIPPDDVETVVGNIMASAKNVFFSIATVDDVCHDFIGQPLHLTIEPHGWWKELLGKYGNVVLDHEQTGVSVFIVRRTTH